MVLRIIDAYCQTCGEPQAHAIAVDDPGSCACNTCGTVQPLVVPLAAVEA